MHELQSQRGETWLPFKKGKYILQDYTSLSVAVEARGSFSVWPPNTSVNGRVIRIAPSLAVLRLLDASCQFTSNEVLSFWLFIPSTPPNKSAFPKTELEELQTISATFLKAVTTCVEERKQVSFEPLGDCWVQSNKCLFDHCVSHHLNLTVEEKL